MSRLKDFQMKVQQIFQPDSSAAMSAICLGETADYKEIESG
jgi:hypothetical protein